MIDWVTVGLCIMFAVLGFFLGYRVEKISRREIGLIVVDQDDPEINGGVYTVWDDDPHEMVKKKVLKDRQKIVMEVAVRSLSHMSQQNQGA